MTAAPDPFDELKSEVVNNLFILKDQLARAPKITSNNSSSEIATEAQISELLLSLQATREDADLLRSACRTLRRRLANPNSDDAPVMLKEREAFCEKTDDELDRIQETIEVLQRRRNQAVQQQQQQQRAPDQRQEREKQQEEELRAHSVADGGGGDDKMNLLQPPSASAADASAAAAASTGPSPLPHDTHNVLIDNRSWDRDAAIKKLRMRQRRRAQGGGGSGTDEEQQQRKRQNEEILRRDGAVLGRLKIWTQQFKEVATDFFEDLEPQQRIIVIAVLSFLAIFLLVALFMHHDSKSSSSSGGGVNATKT